MIPGGTRKPTVGIQKGDSIRWEGTFRKEEGRYREHYTSILGGDSIHELNLELLPLPGSFNISGKDEVIASQIETYAAPENPGLSYHWCILNGSILSHSSMSTIEVQWGEASEGYLYSYAESPVSCRY